MDPVALQILEDGWKRDAHVIGQAARIMRERLNEQTDGRWAAAGYEVNRIYNVLEKSFERLCETFENHFEKSGNYHEKLIERMQIAIQGIRPAFLPEDSIRPIRELKGFRHIFRHAYDLELEPKRIGQIASEAEWCAAQFPRWCSAFLASARETHGL